MNYDECKGCKPHNKRTNHPDITTVICGYRPKSGTAICPCTTCLVKTMCMDDCENFKYYKRTYIVVFH